MGLFRMFFLDPMVGCSFWTLWSDVPNDYLPNGINTSPVYFIVCHGNSELFFVYY